MSSFIKNNSLNEPSWQGFAREPLQHLSAVLHAFVYLILTPESINFNTFLLLVKLIFKGEIRHF
jgi:hypothetical protein